ncbi:uncharacterized protein LOC112341588 isoform X2 [Selaginella moellendorffii]|uniref:uncharacterized protein LOC112341588 isoform X2 n=1 Tax=Selaginella moellendorffii TaxID=88036 RepID=UPI000D1C6E69|nr:uncharacterized protein LOC112341588 isoform X2 [Selaginella moellendorffii]|eukprot:XP_024517740.1 uncharacterized protein LOC112341588 isoform X2 [Selaginella moellendorffii]
MPLAMPPGRKKNWKNSTAAIVQTEKAELLDPIHGVERRGRDPLEIQPPDLLAQDHVLLALARGELEIAGSLWHGHVHREIKERRVDGVALSATLDDQLFQPRESVAKIIRAGWRVPAIELLGSWRRSSWKNFHSRYSKAIKVKRSRCCSWWWKNFGKPSLASKVVKDWTWSGCAWTLPSSSSSPKYWSWLKLRWWSVRAALDGRTEPLEGDAAGSAPIPMIYIYIPVFSDPGRPNSHHRLLVLLSQRCHRRMSSCYEGDSSHHLERNAVQVTGISFRSIWWFIAWKGI